MGPWDFNGTSGLQWGPENHDGPGDHRASGNNNGAWEHNRTWGTQWGSMTTRGHGGNNGTQGHSIMGPGDHNGAQ